jgi:hypothetical protein
VCGGCRKFEVAKENTCCGRPPAECVAKGGNVRCWLDELAAKTRPLEDNTPAELTPREARHKAYTWCSSKKDLVTKSDALGQQKAVPLYCCVYVAVRDRLGDANADAGGFAGFKSTKERKSGAAPSYGEQARAAARAAAAPY